MKFSTSLFAILFVSAIGFAEAAVPIEVSCKDYANKVTNLKLEAPDDLFLTNGPFNPNIGIPAANFNPAEISKMFKVLDQPSNIKSTVYVREGDRFSDSTEASSYNLSLFMQDNADDEKYTVIYLDDILDVAGSAEGNIVMSTVLLRSSEMDQIATGKMYVSDGETRTATKVLCQFK